LYLSELFVDLFRAFCGDYQGKEGLRKAPENCKVEPIYEQLQAILNELRLSSYLALVIFIRVPA